MRTFIAILMMAITLSGYAAAAHAFNDTICNPSSVSGDHHADASGPQDCPDHKAAHDDKSDEGTKHGSAASCLDCHHCCASHAIGLSDQPSYLPLPLVTFTAWPGKEFIGEYHASLLRPPKSLV